MATDLPTAVPGAVPTAVPTLVLASPASGQGKTTVTCALAAALLERGLDVRVFKAGPDYLDTTWHAAVTGQRSRNLDGWMMGPGGVAASLERGARGADLVLVEGMMGLFDGRSPESLEGSTAELAAWLGAPVLLVVDGSAMARSAAALVEGFAHHAPEVRVAGALFNRVGGPEHTALLRRALQDSRGPAGAPLRCLGGLPQRDSLAMPERHLGLVRAPELDAGRRGALAEWAREHVDLDALLDLARTARGLQVAPTPLPASILRGGERPVRIAVARDAALHFTYEDNLELLEAAGAEVLPFSPLEDPALPPGTEGVFLGGGYPEEHAAVLSRNKALRLALREHIAAGRPVLAECGGMMLLGRELTDSGRRTWPMWDLLPLSTALQPRLQAIGYREVRSRRETILGPAGSTWRGHEFRYSRRTEDSAPAEALTWTGAWGAGTCGHVAGPRDNVLGTWVHAHWGATPERAAHLVARCRDAR